VSFSDGKTTIPSGINYNIGIPSALSIGFTVTTVNLGDYTTTDSGQMGSYPILPPPIPMRCLPFMWAAPAAAMAMWRRVS
jgi:hypothetical protein